MISSRVPPSGDPQRRHVPWLGIEPATLWFTGQHSATPARAQGIILKNKDILFWNHSTLIKVRKFDIATKLSFNPQSLFHSCWLSPLYLFLWLFFFPGRGSNPKSHFWFSCDICLVSFHLKQFLNFFCISWPWHFLKNIGHSFCGRSLSLSLSDVSSWLGSGCVIFGKNTTEGMLGPSQYITAGGTWCGFARLEILPIVQQWNVL